MSLDGVRVLDFTRVLAGPYCTMLLGDLGADIVKVESPYGDETRAWGPPWAGEGADRESAYYLSVNRNKRSLTLNLKQPEAQSIAQQLAATSHIVLENFKPGQMAKFGLDYATLKAFNPSLVYVSITGYGQTGPYSDRPGYDHIIQAMSGLMSITGPADGDGFKVGVALTDVITGLFALSGVLEALRHAERTGEGRHLDIALMDCQLSALVNIASAALVSGKTPARYGNAHSTIVPYQNFHAADMPFALAVGNDGQYRALCGVLNRLDLADDPRFSTNPARVMNRQVLVGELEAIFRTQPATHWVELCLSVGIPAGPVQTVTQALNDEHTRARGLIRQTVLPNGQPLKMVASPLLGDAPDAIRHPPPQVGQHTAEILSERLGLSSQDIERLRLSQVI